MNVEKTKALSIMVESFTETYREFLKAHNLEGDATSRIAFYSTMEEIVLDDPIPDDETQALVEQYLAQSKNNSIQDLYEEVEALFLDVSKKKLQK